MKKFKEYEKEYEDVVSTERSLKTISLDKISNVMGLTNYQYIQTMKKFGREMYITIFDLLVRFAWLNTRFNYTNHGLGTDPHCKVDYIRSRFSLFSRHYIGIDFKPIVTGFFPSRVSSYFNDFFPLFNLDNPFDNPDYFKFPYENITPDFLMFVYRMPERLNLLEIAEKRKMTYATFYNYVVNYVMCYNAEHGKEVYTIKYNYGYTGDHVAYNVKKKPHRVKYDQGKASKRIVKVIGNI